MRTCARSCHKGRSEDKNLNLQTKNSSIRQEQVTQNRSRVKRPGLELSSFKAPSFSTNTVVVANVSFGGQIIIGNVTVMVNVTAKDGAARNVIVH